MEVPQRFIICFHFIFTSHLLLKKYFTLSLALFAHTSHFQFNHSQQQPLLFQNRLNSSSTPLISNHTGDTTHESLTELIRNSAPHHVHPHFQPLLVNLLPSLPSMFRLHLVDIPDAAHGITIPVNDDII